MPSGQFSTVLHAGIVPSGRYYKEVTSLTNKSSSDLNRVSLSECKHSNHELTFNIKQRNKLATVGMSLNQSTYARAFKS